MADLQVLAELKDINANRIAEVEALLTGGSLNNLDALEICKRCNQCFVELNLASAAKLYIHFFDKFKEDANYLYFFGYFTYECGFLPLAEQLLQRSVKLAPESEFRKYFILGDMYKIHEPKSALQLFEKGILLAEKEKANMSQEYSTEAAETEKSRKILNKLSDSGRTISQAYCSVAEIMMNMPQFPKNRKNIEAALNKAEEEDPDYLEPCYQRCFLYFNIADEKSCRKEIAKFVEGVRAIEKANDEDLLDYPAVMLVAIVRMMIEGAIWEDGVYLAEIASSNDHQNYEALYMLAFCALNMNDLDTCKETLSKLATFNLDSDPEIKEAAVELHEEYLLKLKELPAEETQKGQKGEMDMENDSDDGGDDWMEDDTESDDENGMQQEK